MDTLVSLQKDMSEAGEPVELCAKLLTLLTLPETEARPRYLSVTDAIGLIDEHDNVKVSQSPVFTRSRRLVRYKLD